MSINRQGFQGLPRGVCSQIPIKGIKRTNCSECTCLIRASSIPSAWAPLPGVHYLLNIFSSFRASTVPTPLKFCLLPLGRVSTSLLQPRTMCHSCLCLLCSSDCFFCRLSYHFQRRQWHPTPVLLPGKSHRWRNLVGCSPWGLKESDMTERLHFHFSLLCTGEGNGNPLQCSCLENPRDGIAQSRTRQKWLSSSSYHFSHSH